MSSSSGLDFPPVGIYYSGGNDVAVADGGTGSSNAPDARRALQSAPNYATYIVQTANTEMANAQALSALATGFVTVTTATGVLSSVATASVPAVAPALGALIYGDATPAWVSLAGNITTTRKFLSQTGTGAVSAAPGWNVIAAADLPIHDHSGATQGGQNLSSPTITNPTFLDLTDNTKTATVDLSGMQAGKNVAMVFTSGGASGAITFPTGNLNPNLAAYNVGQVWSGNQVFPDSSFYISGSADATKFLRFEVDGFTTGTTRVLTPPNADTVLAGLSVAQTFTAKQTITAGATAPQFNAGSFLDYMIWRDTDAGFDANFAFTDALTGNVSFYLPVDGGQLLTSVSTSDVSNKYLQETTTIECQSASVGASFRDTSTAAKRLRLILAPAGAFNHSLTVRNSGGARDYELGACAGQIVMVGTEAAAPTTDNLGKVDLTAQSASIASTNLSSATAAVGFYRVSYYLEITTADVTEVDTVTFAIAHTDDIGATTQAGAALGATVTARQTGSFVAYVASGALSYSATVTNTPFGTARYALRVRAEFLG